MPHYLSESGFLIMYGCSDLFPCFLGSPSLNGRLHEACDDGLIRVGSALSALVYSPLVWGK